ncbi:MAG: type III pantothenate kinase [Rhodothermales bacterium]|nr:type III pantothenate kinase [Rhodothermales bacterium]
MSMHAAIDIGNTRCKIGWTDADGIWTVRSAPTESVQADPGALMAEAPPEVRAVSIVSVVPAAALVIREFLEAPASESDGRMDLFEVLPGCRLPFEMGYRTPETLGNDRLAAAAAAWMEYRGETGVLVLDAGTAVTFEVVDGSATYRGGSIGPGPALLSRALGSGTAQLPDIMDLPGPSAIGRSTAEAIQSGIHWGFRESVAGMIRRYRSELEDQLLVVATGGWAADLAQHIPEIAVVDPHLVLRGAVLLRELSARPVAT